MESSDFKVAEWLVQPSLNRVSRGTEVHSLPTRFMDLLAFLATNRGTVLSKEEIIEAVWRKEYVSEGTLTHAIAVVRQTLGDDTRQPLFIETIPTRGYRLIAPVTRLEGSAADAERSDGTKLRSWRLAAAALGLAVLGLSALVSMQLVTGGRSPARAPGGRIAVLPFENLGAEDRAYLATGVTDDLTTRLAGIPGLSVISRLSALSCARSGKSARQLGQELGADYLLFGTIRFEPAGDRGRMWVNAQLVNAADDTHLWGESYSRPLDSVFDIESDIAGRVVETLGLTVADSLRRRLENRPTRDVDAYQAYLCAMDHSRFETREHLGLAEAMFERATQLDPGFARAWAELGLTHARIYALRFDHGEALLARARDAIDRARAIAPDLAEGLRAEGAYLLFGEHDYERALASFKEAARGLPNDSELRVLIADVHRRQGRWEEARSELEELYSRDPRNYVLALALGDTLSGLRRYGAADIAYRQATSVMPDSVHPYLRRFWNTLRWEGATQRAAEALDELPQPGQPEAVYSRFSLHYYRRDFGAALAVVEEAGGSEVVTSLMHLPPALLECLCLRGLGRAEAAAQRCQAVLSSLAARSAEVERDPALGVVRGYAAALLGRREAAVTEARRVTALGSVASDAVDGAAFLAEAARIYALAGDATRSAEAVSRALSIPSPLSVALVDADPRFDAVRGDPRFVKALEGASESARTTSTAH